MWEIKFTVLKAAAETWQAAESRALLKACCCDLYIGSAELLTSSSDTGVIKTVVRVCRPSGCTELETFHVCIATGSRAHRPSELLPGRTPIHFTKGLIIDATELGLITKLPKSIAIIGAGVIAVESATVYAELGVKRRGFAIVY